jgi:hypothetical protein
MRPPQRIPRGASLAKHRGGGQHQYKEYEKCFVHLKCFVFYFISLKNATKVSIFWQIDRHCGNNFCIFDDNLSTFATQKHHYCNN